jgi:hypothetical protein
MEALNSEMQAVSADLYSQAKNQRQSGEEKTGSPSGDAESRKEDGQPHSQSRDARDKSSKGDGDVIDADFEMVDDKDKK